MNGLKKTLTDLSKEMTSQECYKNYLESLHAVKEDQELYEELNRYRRKNIEIHLNQSSLKEEVKLEKEFHEFLMQEKIREFLHWESKTLEMVRKVHESVDCGLELDMAFF